jgi:hypothetical protein
MAILFPSRANACEMGVVMKPCTWSLLLLALSSTTLGGCARATGPRVRVATATAAELAAVDDKDEVWYEFQPGDIVPVQLGFMGVVEGGSSQPAVFRAKKRFFFVMFKGRPMQISFDGESFAGERSRQSVILVGPREDGKGGELGWIIYMGESGDPEAELKAMLKDHKDRKQRGAEGDVASRQTTR